jgi:hypothetical protein
MACKTYYYYVCRRIGKQTQRTHCTVVDQSGHPEDGQDMIYRHAFGDVYYM